MRHTPEFGLMLALLLAAVLCVFAGCAYQAVRPVSRPITAWTFGTSMLPTIPNGGKFTIVPGRFEDIKIGDIVVRGNYRPAHNVHVTHRAIARWRNGWITRGDNNPRDDEGWMVKEDFVGFVKLP